MAREQPPKHGRPRALWDLDDEEIAEIFEEGSADE
jgi:hypothetical protein